MFNSFQLLKKLNIKNKSLLQKLTIEITKKFQFLKKTYFKNFALNFQTNLKFSFFISTLLKFNHFDFLIFKKQFLNNFLHNFKKLKIRKLSMEKNFYVKKFLKNYLKLKLIQSPKYLFQNLNENLFYLN